MIEKCLSVSNWSSSSTQLQFSTLLLFAGSSSRCCRRSDKFCNCVSVNQLCLGNVHGTGTALSVGIEPTSTTQYRCSQQRLFEREVFHHLRYQHRAANVSSGNLLQYFKDQVWIYVGKYSKHCVWNQGDRVEENTTYENLVNCYHQTIATKALDNSTR